ncbi:GGDEF domain-containing protein [Streptomyces avermitilis]|uniref:GGDEF domain-containing protein n=1 Tax=Streptomyces avermitilis TaxID=33903 RepID=UPI0036C10956
MRRQLHAARRDPLTGLPGRDVLIDRTARLARTHHEHLHVLVADADGLKTVNDTLGHAAGDTLIAAVGHRIGAWAAVRGGLAARLGGDEFAAALLLPRRPCGQCECAPEFPGTPPRTASLAALCSAPTGRVTRKGEN